LQDDRGGSLLSGFILEGVPPTVFWIFVATAIVVQGISKSGFAGGAGILSLPLMMLVMPVDKVAATLLPLLILCDFNAIYHHRHNKNWAHIRAIYVPAFFGILAGSAVWWWMKENGVEQYTGIIKRFTGVISILFAVYIVAKEAALRSVEQYKPGLVATWVAGLSAGFCSAIANAAGPIVGLYMFAQDMGKSLFVGTVAWTFTLINLTKLPFFFAVDLVDHRVLLFDLVLIPLIPIGSYLGKWMHQRVPERPFNWIVFALTLVAGVQLLFKIDVIRMLVGAVTF
jgi:uncharacterized membrane protein YfcA